MTAALTEVHPDALWVADQPFKVHGLEMGSRMTVVRLVDDSLVLLSPIELTAELRNELDSLGPVSVIIAPSNMHYLDFDAAAAAYPQARRFALAAIGDKVTSSFEELTAKTDQPWADVLATQHFTGSRVLEEVAFYHGHSASLIVFDLCHNLGAQPWPRARVMALLAGVNDRFAVSRVLRLSINNAAAARESIDTLLMWPFQRVVVAHGAIAVDDAHARLERAWSWLRAD